MKKTGKAEESLGKKGFTLIELIVVLAILAVLVGIMVPSMIGWVDKARDSQVLLEARTAYISLETLVAEASIQEDVSQIDNEDIDEDVLWDMAGIQDDQVILEFQVEEGEITDFRYEKDGRAAVLKDGGGLEIETEE